jgi:sortase A
MNRARRPLASLLRAARRPRGEPPGRVRRALSWLLVAAGVLLLADAVATLVWKEPVTAARAAIAQHRLERDLDRLAVERLQAAALRSTRAADDRARVAALARALGREVPRGEAIGRLSIPRIGVRAVVVHGSDPATLRRGPGTVDGSPLPGARGTAAIAGHRTTYGAHFRDIDQLQPGDAVVATMPYATLRYQVTGSRIVDPGDVGVLRSRDAGRLVLIACHPRFSAAQRIVVTARLTGVVPRVAAGARTAFGRSARIVKSASWRPDAWADAGHPSPHSPR